MTTETAPPDPEEAQEEARQASEAPVDEAAPTAPAAAANGGSWRYYVGEQGPFETVHAALLAHGVTQEEIDSHKYWHRHDRLPKGYADAIRRERLLDSPKD